MRVRVANSERGFDAASGQSLLDAALAASWKLPHGCRGGNCGLCKARLVSGEVHYLNGPPLGLGEDESGAGYILLCQATPRSDLELELHEVRTAYERGATRLPCRIERATRVAHDVMNLSLRLPPAADFQFLPGQYVDILLPGDRRRSLSIASAPRATHLLELHVRRVMDGVLSDALFGACASADSAPPATLMQGSLVTIEGPLGAFYYRAAMPGAGPVLLIGGGTGVAPLLSILRHLVDAGIERDLVLYWGVRGLRDRYAENDIRELQSRTARMRYELVLSEPEPGWRGRTGLVHAAVLEDVADLSAYDIYAAGPPGLIEALRSAYPRHGARLDRMYCDAFDYARDPFARQSASAATKS